MPPRGDNTITAMIAQAQKKLEEIKELQFFGGDAINLKRYTLPVEIEADQPFYSCYKITMTPSLPEWTMPIEVGVKPANAETYPVGHIEAINKTDGTFEWIVIFDPNYLFDPVDNDFYIIYSGTASFVVTQLG
jgi:hypothetical protein